MQRLRTINYFSKPVPTTDERKIKQELIATRLYFLLLTISCVVLISYYAAERVTTFHQIESPTFEQFIHLQNDQNANPSLSCPCLTLTTAYKDLIKVDYILHPFCSSDFVQQNWFNYSLHHDVFIMDFRFLAPSFFHSLASYCIAASSYIEESLISFYATSFIADQALASKIFAEQANAIFNTFKSTATRSFTHDLAVISNVTRTNAIISSKGTNFELYLEGVYPSYSFLYRFVPHVIFTGSTYSICFCLPNIQCFVPLSVYSDDPYNIYIVANIPGLFTGCLLDDGILHSNLACMFSQPCVDFMYSWLNKTTVNAVEVRNLRHFDPNSTVGDILNQLFVDRWNYSTSHRVFYQQCKPARCTYTLVEHNAFWLILTTVFGIIGGLMKTLQILVPRLVQGVYFLKSRCRHHGHQENVTAAVPSTFSFRLTLNRLHQLNLFPSDDPAADNEREVIGQIISTRLYIVLLLISLISLVFYSSQVRVTRTVTISDPPIEQYLWLYNSYYQTLSCPCARITIPQGTFLTVQPTFHQVCKSNFIDPAWSTGITYTIQTPDIVYYGDFRVFGGAFFTTIASLCQLSATTINDGLLDFGLSSLVTTHVTPRDQLVSQGKLLIELFISTTTNAFVSSLQTIRYTTQGNALLSGLGTSASIIALAFNQTDIQMEITPNIYNWCVCQNDPTCIERTGLYRYSNVTLVYEIPGFFYGCYIIEATLKSNLALLYNQSQIDDLRAHIQFDHYNPVPFTTTALNASLDSQYNTTTPIKIIMQQMMTELWSKNVNYSSYYKQCHPVECKYTYVVQYDVVYIVTTIAGLIGGLTSILGLVIPRVVKLIRWCWFERFRSTRIQVISAVVTRNDQWYQQLNFHSILLSCKSTAVVVSALSLYSVLIYSCLI